ncbi:MAG: cysteine dioxygenase family protein [Planctomycetota bacterium]
MDASLDNYIDLVRDISTECLPPQQAVPLIVKEAERLAGSGVRLNPLQRQPGRGLAHGRHLLYEDPTSDFVVMAMVWPAGADSQPHDHETWGVVAVLEGELEVTEYERGPRGEGLVVTARVTTRPGDVAWVIPPERDLHRMRNTSGRPAITLHTYGRAIETCHAYDERSGERRLVRPEYSTRPEPWLRVVV